VKLSIEKFTKCFDSAEKISAVVAGYVIVCLMLLTVLDVAVRAIAGESIEGVYTLSELLMVAVCFLATAFTQKENAHVTMDFLMVRLKGRILNYTEVFASILSVAICALLSYRATVEAIGAVEMKLVAAGTVPWPAWPFKIAVAFGFLLLLIRVSIQFTQKLRLLLSRGCHVLS
jgi:TRAP-type C4-dicarboxylate transport system permease small subunit